MKKEMERAEPDQSGEVAFPSTPALDDILSSRAIATDRIFKGGILAVLSFGGALLLDFLNISSGLPFWIGISAALTAFGAGSVWAGSGASHLFRHGRRGSALWLASLAGLGGSVILDMVSGGLLVAWENTVLFMVNRLAMAACGVFTIALIILGLVTVVRWLHPDTDPMSGDGAWETPGGEAHGRGKGDI